ncbi:MAG: cysteine hydrolase family protein [Solimonas sp.]
MDDVELLRDPLLVAPMLAPRRTALVVIDVQIDFAAPDGLMAQWGTDLALAEQAIDRIVPLLAAARSQAVPVVFVRVVTRADTDGAALKLYYARRGYPPEAVAICREEGRGADYYRLFPQPGDIEIRKRLFSAFAGTDLDAQLRARGIDTLLLVGLTTDCCVDCTARDAFHRDFSVFIAADACAAYDGALHAASLGVLSKNCALLTSSDAVLASWATAA